MRGCLLGLGIILAVLGLAVAARHASLLWGWQLALPGLLLVAAVAVERWRYRAVDRDRPGPDWQATGERFVDPETGKLVTVYDKPATGERRYVSS
jgi:membrane protein implicated in regulation of membrane protease activity